MKTNTEGHHDWRERPIGSLTGVGPQIAAKLQKLGVATVGQLVRHYPRRYDDFSQIIPIRMMRPGNVTFKGEIERVNSRYARGKKLHLTEAIIADGTGTVKAVWFNQSYLAKSIPTGTPVLISGELKFKNNDLAMQSPAIEPIEPGRSTKNTARIVPVYPETAGLTSKQLRGLIQPLMPLVTTTAETLPPDIIRDGKLMSLGKALCEIHFPTSQAMLTKARHRLAFEELWFLMLASLVIKHEIQTETAPTVEFRVAVAQEFTRNLGFEMTPQQKQAAWEILQDLGRTSPMNRLLEGDVGSGKTVVATMAAVMTMSSGHQTALMVPTEVLARQHYANLRPMVTKLGFEAALILGGQPAAERRETQALIAGGKPLLVIGTQALLSEKIALGNLGLVIIDEQHRFGVNQRSLLKAKAGYLPHLLTMTATPIPRTLQLTIYGDLDISVISALPPGRQPITTRLIDNGHRAEVYKFISEQLDAGRQGFVVCPLINESDTGRAAKSVTAEFEQLSQGPFSNRRLGLLHGKLAPADKQAVMNQFASGQLDLIVTTTVIEVGVDVPNATIMLIENAETFGLAALHQLRGRVGRGEYPSHCFMLADTKSTGTQERLRALEKSQDGFRLAQIDLELRGPGQIYGRMQHGTLDLELADLGDSKLIAKARAAALKFLSQPDAMIKYQYVTAKVNALKAVTSLD